MSETELQDEEREVLSSIYDGDNCFKQISSNTFQYKFGESDAMKSFLLEIQWGEKYPNEAPKVNMDTFYNKHITKPLKDKIVSVVEEEALQFLGMSMTYSLFEFIKEKFEELMLEQPEEIIETVEKSPSPELEQTTSQKVPKKEHLTKAQKRRQWNRIDSKGEKPRGWNWVDIVKHLSQTGPKEPTPTS
ncbi:RWD domain-containing protein 4 [Tribolium madens]|uniref:RWD domain-containing protein 4 n=1 Tax=Tribolium madens TaxID=41895 RepID=UPI001CF753CF|nr:RWD domain-containing protein 4 [Tribolium madens]